MKTNVNSLAIFGNIPTFSRRLHVGRPNIGNREKFLERVNTMLDSKWLSNGGPFVQEFEGAICELTGVKHCIAVCNATIGLEILIRAAGLIGEVIVPSFTFIATAHALQWHGVTPVFCDVDPDMHTLDPARVENLITAKTTGIIGVHVWGRACNVDALEQLSRKHHLKLLFDAAHAFGCSHNGQMIGNFGQAEVFSFHATKFINTFEGGAIVTNDDALATRIRLMKNFGFAGVDNVIEIGTNGKMSEISAAMGLTNLEKMGEIVQTNYDNYRRYSSKLAGIPGISLVAFPESERNNYQHIIIVIDEEIAGVTRDQMAEIMYYENVLARRYFYPGCHQMEPYRTDYPVTGLFLPETEKLSNRVLSLPTGTDLTIEDIDNICQIIRLVVEQNVEINHQMAQRRAAQAISGSLIPSTHSQHLISAGSPSATKASAQPGVGGNE
jgi:dTDP-4-amino-4,6-dideoxygalactose transaminase